MKKASILFTSLSLVLGLASSPMLLLAQEEGGPPADVQKGPSAEELKQFEQEMGAPPEAFGHSAAIPPDTDEVRSLPEDLKQYASEKELAEIYCAMTKWKSGDFFSAMDAIEQHLIPAIQKVKDLGATVETPDIAAIRQESQRRLDAICSATTLGDAEKLTRDFKAWGQSEGREKLGSQLSQDIEKQMKAKGDALREKIQTDIKTFTDQESKVMQDEIQQKVDSLVAQKKAQIEAAAKASKGSGVEAMVAQAKAEINSQVQSFVAQKTTQLKEKIKLKVEEIVGAQKKQMEEAGQALSAAGAKIDEAILANRVKYEQYKEQAFALRKKVVFKMLDKNITDGLAKLEAGSADIEAARQKDPTIKSVAEVKASLAADRQALESKLNAALAAGDDAAFEQALLDFKTRWEDYRIEMEKVAKQSLDKACAEATAQFGSAKKQIDEGVKKIKDVQQRCAAVASEECSAINGFADRFNTILGKFSDIKSEMAVAEKMCVAPEQADKDSLLAVMKKIQTDAEDLKVYGQALEAAKQKALVDSARQVCDQALPQLKAAQVEIQKNDLVVLKNSLDKCSGKNTEECQSVNSLRGEYGSLVAAQNAFAADRAQLDKFCAASVDEEDLMQISAVLGNLKSQGDQIRVKAKELQAKQAEKASAKAFCRGISGVVSLATASLTSGLKELTDGQKSCAGKKDEKCQAIGLLSSKFDSARSNINGAVKKAGEISAACGQAGIEAPSQDLVAKAESFKNDEASIKKEIAELRDAIDKATLSGSGSVSFEAESAVSYNTRTGVSNPMAREVTPSWRPAYFGNGSWYMGAGGDYLNYEFSVPASAKYNVWVRDYVDKYQARGIRRIIVEFDGKRYGAFAENGGSVGGDKGSFAWHKIGEGITLNKGTHKMKITKESTTKGAAILDAFYFTTGTETPAEK